MRLKLIWAMLEKCAPGHTVKQRVHNYAVTYKGRMFPRLPIGEHGSRDNPELQIHHVRKMVRHLSIDLDCAAGVIPLLAGR